MRFQHRVSERTKRMEKLEERNKQIVWRWKIHEDEKYVEMENI